MGRRRALRDVRRRRVHDEIIADENLSRKRLRKSDEGGEEERFTDLMRTMLRESYMGKNVSTAKVTTNNNVKEEEKVTTHNMKEVVKVGEGKLFRDLRGMKEILENLRKEVILPLHHPPVLKELGVRRSLPGILLHGPPGCGKTTLAHAIANETALPFYSVSGSELTSHLDVKDLFSQAHRTAPSIIFIDEIDAIASKVENSQRGTEKRVLKQLLTCMGQPVHTSSANVLVIAATNSADALDPALRRPGRFGREIFMGIPDEAAREDILSEEFRNHKCKGPMDLKNLVRSTGGFVAADLNDLVFRSAIEAMYRTVGERNLAREQPREDWEKEPWTPKEVQDVAIQMSDIKEALKKVQPSTRREGFSALPDVKWEEIGGLGLLRQEFEDYIIGPIKHPEHYEGGLNLETGFLLYGPPGCGKTMIAKAVANAAGASFIHIKGPELLSKFVGESERDLRTLFNRARTSAPCIIFFDEVDALATKRGKEGGWVTQRLLNQWLIELDGAERRKGVFVIGATNRPEVVDPAILRPGRLGKLLYVPLPSPEERVLILKTIARKMPIDASVDLSAIARMKACDNMSGADLNKLMNEAFLASIKEKRASTNTNCDTFTIKEHHLYKTLSKVFPSVSDRERKHYQHLSETFNPRFHRSVMERGGREKKEMSHFGEEWKRGRRRKSSMGSSKKSSRHWRQDNLKEDKNEILAPTFAHDPLWLM